VGNRGHLWGLPLVVVWEGTARFVSYFIDSFVRVGGEMVLWLLRISYRGWDVEWKDAVLTRFVEVASVGSNGV
jgi:hypothetical protein